jgi:Na+-driven multidrug efflux pump
MWFIVPFGTVAVAAHTLCQRVEMFVLMIGMGWGRGAGVLVGQNLGAQKPERAERSGWLAAGVVQILTLACAISILVWPEGIIRIFGPEPSVEQEAAIFIRIAAVGFFLFGLEPVLMQSLTGAGDSIPPMLATTMSFWIIQVPLAYLLPQFAGMGVYGIRWGMVAGRLLNALTLAIYFKSGRWKHKNI